MFVTGQTMSIEPHDSDGLIIDCRIDSLLMAGMYMEMNSGADFMWTGLGDIQ